MDLFNIKNHYDFIKLNLDFLHGKIDITPYHYGKINDETHEILDELIKMNEYGILTIESQPGCNKKRLKQKPYVCFYSNKENAFIMRQLEKYKCLIRISYREKILYCSEKLICPYTITVSDGEDFSFIQDFIYDDIKEYNKEEYYVEIIYPEFKNINIFEWIIKLIEINLSSLTTVKYNNLIHIHP